MLIAITMHKPPNIEYYPIEKCESIAIGQRNK